MSSPAPNYHRVFHYSFERCIKNSEFLEDTEHMIQGSRIPLRRFLEPLDQETRLKVLHAILVNMIRADYSPEAQERVLSLREIMLQQGIKLHPERGGELSELLQDVAQRFDPIWTSGVDTAWTKQFKVAVALLYKGQLDKEHNTSKPQATHNKKMIKAIHQADYHAEETC